MNENGRTWLSRFWRESLKPFLVFALVLGAFRSAVADWNDIPSGSMKPTLLEGDRVIVNRMAYDLRVPFLGWSLMHRSDPSRGDIVVLWSPVDGRRLVKRAVGIPGDTVTVRQGRLLINGVAARYEPLTDEARRRLAITDLDPGSFALERLGSQTHAVMASEGWPAGRDFGPTRVPLGQYCLVGDHRDDSFDSRYWGFAERDRIIGRATAVVFSLDWERYGKPRWPRFLTPLS